MNSLPPSRSGTIPRVLLRPRFAFAIGGTLLVAALSLPSTFDDTFETIANHGQSAPKAFAGKKGTSAVHVAITGVVPKYDGRTDDKWWESEGASRPAESGERLAKGNRATQGPSLLHLLRQQLGNSGASVTGDFGASFRSIGSSEARSGAASTLDLLALNPFGDVQTMAASLPASAIFHASGVPLRENIVPVDDGSNSSASVPSPHTWNSYAAVPISVNDGSAAISSAPVVAPPATIASLSVPTPSLPNLFASVPTQTNSVSAPAPVLVPVSSPVVQPVASSAPTITPGLRLFAQIPSAAPTAATPTTLTTSAISGSTSGTTTPTGPAKIVSDTSSANIGYQFVPVGNPGNANDPATGNKFGGVSYSYDIGQYDVTLSQYATFLNAVAQADTYGLYNPSMASDGHVAGITQSGANGNYSYTVVGDGQRPVTYVSWFDAARFANWVNNGQPIGKGEINGSTEDGAYTLHGATAGVVTKNANAQVWIPSESEWYKAAYYDPTLNGGAGGYWSDAAQSNSLPGNTIGSQPNQGNYLFATGGAGGTYLTDVGAFTMSMSPYGTFDQMGDVDQWNDGISGADRGLRGGAWDSPAATYLLSTNFTYGDPELTEAADIGFRLAAIPEPAAWPSLLGGLGLLVIRRRRRTAA